MHHLPGRLAAAAVALLFVSGCGTVPTPPPNPSASLDPTPVPADASIELSAAAIGEHLAALQAIADEHDGTRAAGTTGCRASVDYVVGQLRDMGFTVTTPVVGAPDGRIGPMRVSAKADYALRAVAELAVASEGPLKRERIAAAQQIPMDYLENILLELKHVGIVQSQRGAAGGFRLARPPEEISLADVIRAVDGPMANVRGSRPEEVEYLGPAVHLRDVWIAVRAALRELLEATSVRDLVDGTLPARMDELTRAPEAWVSLGRVRGSRRGGGGSVSG